MSSFEINIKIEVAVCTDLRAWMVSGRWNIVLQQAVLALEGFSLLF